MEMTPSTALDAGLPATELRLNSEGMGASVDGYKVIFCTRKSI